MFNFRSHSTLDFAILTLLQSFQVWQSLCPSATGMKVDGICDETGKIVKDDI